jgi:putative acetyltransferase
MDQPIVRHGTLRLPFEPVERNRVLAEPPEGSTRTLVATASGQIIGIACLKPGQNRRAHCGDIALLAVDERWQRRGVGGALLAALVDIADNWLGLKRLHLTVLADNVAAIALYQRFGFVIEGQKRADIFRAGGFADSKVMARVKDR